MIDPIHQNRFRFAIAWNPMPVDQIRRMMTEFMKEATAELNPPAR